MNKPIRGKVARVLNGREIVLNIGTANGVVVDMYFDVIDADELEIRDPDTNQLLGSIERSKIRVKIIHAQEKLSVAACSPYVSVRQWKSSGWTSSRGTLGPFAKSLLQSEETDSEASVGDAVVQVIEETGEERKVLATDTKDLSASFEGT
ncbi:MAG: hypothetical protein OXT74_05195 [Candidatus Poribacteria bacterium]|nr:hypothetical protein [Candidatus Poribacteria bacterium]